VHTHIILIQTQGTRAGSSPTLESSGIGGREGIAAGVDGGGSSGKEGMRGLGARVGGNSSLEVTEEEGDSLAGLTGVCLCLYVCVGVEGGGREGCVYVCVCVMC